MAFLYVFLGGGLGSMARFGIAKMLAHYNFTFPWATFIANIFACIILGALTAYAAKNGISDTLRYTFMIGFCGGFSTFSTFSSETFKLIEQGQLPYAFANILFSVFICLLGIYIGIRLVK
jgi:CrcB protein